MIAVSPAVAAPVSPSAARQAVAGWLTLTPTPLETRVDWPAGSAVEIVTNAQGQPLYAIVSLQPEGFIVTSLETALEPIIAFAPTGHFDPSSQSPLRSVLERDLQSRLEQSRRPPQAQPPSAAAVPVAKWARLLQRPAALQSPGPANPSSLDDLRVAPFVANRWNQGTIWNGSAYVACYNYYTPPYGAGESRNYPSGCTATAWGQILRYFQFPTAGVGSAEFGIEVDGTNTTRRLRGGDGLGGPYNWNQMPAIPGRGITDAERQSIGALLADLGVASGAAYTAAETSAPMEGRTLTSVFGFSNVVFGNGLGTGFADAVNANLDARLPVAMDVGGDAAQHVVVVDGYGFNLGTPYHHLNLGWGGTADAWYNLPNVGTAYNFNLVVGYAYNLYTNGTGEIVSGRMTESNQAPVTNALLRLSGGGVERSALTDERGIYAFALLPSGTSFQITVEQPGYPFLPRTVTTGRSQSAGAVGNKWGVDFSGPRDPSKTWVIGTVLSPSGVGVAGVVVQFSNGGGQAVTDATGTFQNAVPVGWSGTITPSLRAYLFTPPVRSVADLATNLLNQDFIGATLHLFGAARTAAGNGLAGVTVQLGEGGSVVSTDASGFYQDTVPPGWSGTITPQRPGFTFAPASWSVTNLTTDLALDFVGSVQFLFVDARATGANHGATWADAFTNLQSAVALATPGAEIWVAAGVYQAGPDRLAFPCPVGVSLYGGFSGGEKTRAERDWQQHVTTLSGEFETPGGGTDFCYHVVKGAPGARLDGFTITAGNAASLANADDRNGGGIWLARNVTNFLVANCRLVGNAAAQFGGGAYNVRLTNCVLSGNTAGNGGGLAYGALVGGVLTSNAATVGGGAYRSSLTNCLVSRNEAGYGGGGYAVTNVNCTVVNNHATLYAGGLDGGSALNSIVYFNTTSNFVENFIFVTFAYSCTYPDPGGDHVMTNAPRFADPLKEDYRLAPGSPGIDAGYYQSWMAGAVDLAGQPRVVNGVVDLGAYESGLFGPVLVLSRKDSTMQISFLGAAGAHYTLEYKNSLADPTWQAVAQIVGNGLPQTWVDPAPNPRQRFYRLRQL